ASALINREPTQGDPWTDLFDAWALVGYGQVEHARTALGRVQTIAETDSALHAARGHLFFLLGDMKKAAVDIDTALGQDPDITLARLDRGRIALDQKRPVEAADDLVAVLSALPDDRNMNADRFPVDLLLASSDQAFERAVALRPDDPQLWVAR